MRGGQIQRRGAISELCPLPLHPMLQGDRHGTCDEPLCGAGALPMDIGAGVDRKVAMMISGHKTESVFNRYNITDDRDLEDAIRKTDAYIAQLPTERENLTQSDHQTDEGDSK